jgi:hypothetical protein
LTVIGFGDAGKFGLTVLGFGEAGRFGFTVLCEDNPCFSLLKFEDTAALEMAKFTAATMMSVVTSAVSRLKLRYVDLAIMTPVCRF